MNKKLKILLAAVLFGAVFMQHKIGEHLKLGQTKNHQMPTDVQEYEEPISLNNFRKDNSISNDTLYRWDDQLLKWMAVNETEEYQVVLTNYSPTENYSQQPIELEWEVLMDIQYQLRYFKELDMEIYAPVFGKAQKNLDGQEVIIKGFVIPFDEGEELLSLSANPYASCFFCGKASPASVVSMYLRNNGRRYKMDDFKKFRGTLHLNYDDPNEFYYILQDAREE